jgi:D-glycero-D-manno-heptose 1,7-bisphosphate phosphatase
LNKAIVRNGLPYPPSDAAEFAPEDGALEAVARIAQRIPLLFVVSNQPDVARGTRTREQVEALNELLLRQFPVTQVYVCYHDDVDACDCRKPKAGLLQRAAQEYGVDLSQSYMVGDRWRDVGAGLAAGCTTILIRKNYAEGPVAPQPHVSVRSISEAADFIIGEEHLRGKAARMNFA